MINWDQVDQLRNEVGQDEFAEVVEIFLEEVEQVAERLARAADTASLGEDLHFLKGCALNLGFENLSTMCQAGERMAADGRADDVEIKPILDCYNTSLDVFLEGIAEQAVA